MNNFASCFGLFLPPKNTTGQLTQQITLSNGKIIPKGSTVVNNGNAYKATLPDGSVVKWNGNKVTPQQGLPAPTGLTTTNFDSVISFFKSNNKLPNNYITKEEAKALGWSPKKGNLTSIAPGKSIGGDVFKNSEGLLPDAPNRIWYEADINYTSGYRNSERLLYSSDGLLYKSIDHYKTFTKVE